MNIGRLVGLQILCACVAAMAAPPSEGLVAYWPLDDRGGAVATDLSGNGNNGTIVTATWTDGARGAALRFKGDGYVECPSSASLSLRDSVTISAWIFLTEYPAEKVSWGWRDIVNKPGAYQLSLVAASGLTFGGLNSGKMSRWVAPDSDFTLKRWHHVAVTYDMSHNAQHIYIDGSERAVNRPVRVFAIDTSDAKLRIGCQDGGTRHGNSNMWIGSIDEVRIYNRALAADEVAQLFQSVREGK